MYKCYKIKKYVSYESYFSILSIQNNSFSVKLYFAKCKIRNCAIFKLVLITGCHGTNAPLRKCVRLRPNILLLFPFFPQTKWEFFIRV